MKSNEYRVMYNSYDGKGNQFYSLAANIVEAIEMIADIKRLWLYKGIAWIEVREVEAWKKVKLIK